MDVRTRQEGGGDRYRRNGTGCKDKLAGTPVESACVVFVIHMYFSCCWYGGRETKGGTILWMARSHCSCARAHPVSLLEPDGGTHEEDDMEKRHHRAILDCRQAVSENVPCLLMPFSPAVLLVRHLAGKCNDCSWKLSADACSILQKTALH